MPHRFHPARVTQPDYQASDAGYPTRDRRGRGGASGPARVLLGIALMAGLCVPAGVPAAAMAVTVSDEADVALSGEGAPDSGTSAETPSVDTDSTPEEGSAAEAPPSDEAAADDSVSDPADTDEATSDTLVPGAESVTPIAPMTVPVAPAGSAVISVKVGGDRLANSTVQGLAGARLGLYGSGTATTGGGAAGASNNPVQGAAGTRHNANWGWTTCVSDADGDCNFVIPIRNGAASATGVQADTRFWVVQESSPSGWYANPTLRIGGFGASPDTAWQYRFRTDTQLRAGTTYRSTTAMEWNTDAGTGNPDRFFMRNRVSTNAEEWWASNVTRTTGVWNQSRANPALIQSCGIDVALIADTSGSLGAAGIASMKGTMGAFVDAFQGTNSRMALFSFSNVSPGNGASNHPNLLPVSTAAQGAAFKAQYASWASGGGTNWDRGFAEAANAASHYDLAILLTDGNPTVLRDNSNSGSSAFNALQNVDAGIFSANQLKSQGTRVVSVGVGSALTTASEGNLRAVSGTTAGSDYLRAGSFADATAALVALAEGNCQSSIGVQKMIVPEGGTIADATQAPAGWRFDANSNSTNVAIAGAATQTTVDGGNGKVDFGLKFTSGTSGTVQVVETQQDGYEIFPVGAGADARNAVCTNLETGQQVPVQNAGTAAQPGFTVAGLRDARVECVVYNTVVTPGSVNVTKTSDPPSGTVVAPGQNVTYTLSFTNPGGQPAQVASDDVLTGVLDDATLVDGPVAESPLQASLNAAGDRMLITGTLAGGTTRTVSYTVRVADPLPETGDAKLANVVVPTGTEPPETCEPETPCTEHPIRVGLTWNKVNLTGERLSGSVWKLTPRDEAGALLDAAALEVIDCVADTATECTGADRDQRAGQFAIAELTPGKYQLRETVAPAGYALLADPIEVTLDRNLAIGDVKNTQSEVPVLPLTGGTGTLIFTLFAGGLGLAVAAGLFWQRRRAVRVAAPTV